MSAGARLRHGTPAEARSPSAPTANSPHARSAPWLFFIFTSYWLLEKIKFKFRRIALCAGAPRAPCDRSG